MREYTLNGRELVEEMLSLPLTKRVVKVFTRRCILICTEVKIRPCMKRSADWRRLTYRLVENDKDTYTLDRSLNERGSTCNGKRGNVTTATKEMITA